ncbi:MAG: histidinol-phosphatase HisJ family protein [Butyrivibrio sp.]|nr:histidinol-phosphatase HisJ family protein [Butyrivibrio sp.]
MFLPADYHMHSYYSGDSKAPMEDMIESSIKRGLKEICFTDHMDLEYPPLPEVTPGLFEFDTDSYKKEILSLREKYKDKINIKFGVELGLQDHIPDLNKEYVSKYDFDFVIGSIHVLDRQDPYYKEYWEGKSESDVLNRCFELTLENMKLFKDFDVLGHFDYVIRYSPYKGAEYNYESFSEIIDAILSFLIKNDKGLDLNTKAIYGYGLEPNPHAFVLKRYKELGGRIITFGSDAHTPDVVGAAFEQAKEIALSCGLTEYCTYDAHVPTFHKL